ncbi:BRCA1-associated RING domain protein 1-like isoform X2 [Styela clava]|uniref:BRCA1-associated RING domain protein 1-like isoform X2 n=1 Tax=Styela clava TaxID=7725 RepID=UPI00193AA879|nr:BRCA1-associated RING domain protein 1-like isoform X2 [Styela clava]
MALMKDTSLAMWLDPPVDFSQSLQEIEKLEKQLSCNSCNKYMTEPITLWSCDHIFCQDCIETMNDKCKVCNLPCWPEDQTENKAIMDIARLTTSLKELLEGYMLETNQVSRLSRKNNEKHPEEKSKSDKRNTAESTKSKKSTNTRAVSKKRSKFKITPSKPFPEITSDSEDSQPTENNNKNTAIIDDANRSPAKKPKANDDTDSHLKEALNNNNFATPSPPPKRKRALIRTPRTPLYTPNRNVSSPSGMKTPKTPRSTKKNKRGETLLHIAAMKGKIDDMKKLIEEGADLNAKDNAGWTPLHEACNHGHIDAVRQLLESGVLVNTPGYEDETALMDAVLNRHLAIVELLLQYGADTSLRNSHGQTAFDLAIDRNIKDLVVEHKYDSLDNTSSETEQLPDFAPEEIIISYSNSVRFDKVKTCAEILKAIVNTKDAVSATHYIVPSYEDGKAPRTIKYMQAVAKGIWIVKCDWLEACTVTGGWVAENSFEILGSREDILIGGPKKSRLNKAAQCPAVFHGCHFYLSGNFKPPNATKQQLGELLQSAGGILLSREPKPDSDSIQLCTKVPYHAQKDSAQYFYTYYIVYDGNQGKPSRLVRRGKVCSVPLSWIFDCISQFCLCEIPG